MKENVMLNQLETFSDREWNVLFSIMEKRARDSVSKLDGDKKYHYLGELDDPMEALCYFATMEDVKKCHGRKENWFICSDGSFYICGDAEVDALYESGKVIDYDLPFETERYEEYSEFSFNGRVSFRMELQGISKEIATKIVCDELDISPYANTYLFEVIETRLNSMDNTLSMNTYQRCIEADTEEEAREKLSIPKVGNVVQSGRRFSNGFARHYTVTLNNIDVTLKKVVENDLYRFFCIGSKEERGVRYAD